jgi:hypothetical protein
MDMDMDMAGAIEAVGATTTVGIAAITTAGGTIDSGFYAMVRMAASFVSQMPGPAHRLAQCGDLSGVRSAPHCRSTLLASGMAYRPCKERLMRVTMSSQSCSSLAG